MINDYSKNDYLGVPWLVPAITAVASVTGGVIGAVANRKNRKASEKAQILAQEHEIRMQELREKRDNAKKEKRNKLLMLGIPSVVGAGALLLHGDNDNYINSINDIARIKQATKRIRRKKLAQKIIKKGF